MKALKKIISVMLVIASIFSLLAVSACAEESEYKTWSLNESVTAAFTDNGSYGFVLTVSGEGAMPDYSSKKDAPWYSKSGRVTQIVIEDGITYIGDYSFTECAAKSIMLPDSVTAVGVSAFKSSAKVYSYTEVTTGEGTIVYTYSATKPAGGYYWYLDASGEPAIWKTVKVLFIGNSFTYYREMPDLFANIANAAGQTVIAESVTVGSHTLTQFADETDEYGKQVADKLDAYSDYDAVVLQEQSTTPINNYDEFYSAVEALKTKINKTQDDCEIYLYSTWGYTSLAESLNCTIPEAEAKIRAAYEKCADALDLKVSYVGKAFTAAYEDYSGTINLYADDDKHPSYEGAFLSACVHAATILNIDVRISTYESTQTTNEEILKQIAYDTVYGT
ncbi:MAG: leucine-rich repeat protein [Clostridia bacterium]|nr:leucine-rich repeat protein [Clostridia bacterium]